MGGAERCAQHVPAGCRSASRSWDTRTRCTKSNLDLFRYSMRLVENSICDRDYDTRNVHEVVIVDGSNPAAFAVPSDLQAKAADTHDSDTMISDDQTCIASFQVEDMLAHGTFGIFRQFLSLKQSSLIVRLKTTIFILLVQDDRLT